MVLIEVSLSAIHKKESTLSDVLVNILKPDGEIEGILSQSTVVRYLYENRKQFPELDKAMSKTVSFYIALVWSSDLEK